MTQVRSQNINQKQWWGNFDFTTNSAQKWQVGPLELNIQRQENEWRVSSSYAKDAQDDVSEISKIELSDDVGSDFKRFSARKSDFQIKVSAQLADRPIVARPESPFYVPAGEEVFVYISSPLWLKLAVRKGATTLVEVQVIEFPIHGLGAHQLTGNSVTPRELTLDLV